MQLSQRDTQRYPNIPLIAEQSIIEKDRRCTDVLCMVLFILFFLGFIGLMTYGIIAGNFDKVFTVYNSDGVRCQSTNFPLGFFPDTNQLKNVICVKTCPDQTTTPISCLPEAIGCPTGTFTATYTSFEAAFLCLPNDDVLGISELSTSNIFTNWSYDLSYGYLILVGAALAAILLALVFMIFMRCCAKQIIWFLIIVAIICIIGIGILFILESQGINISPYVNHVIPALSVNTMIIIGSVMIAVGLFIAIICFCLCSRISLASKAVEMAAIYVFETCYIVIVPLTQAIILLGIFAGIIIGAAYLYSTGNTTLPKNNAFVQVDFDTNLIIMMSFMVFGGFWTLCFIHGSNHFILSSSACIWYFTHNDYSQQKESRCCDSFARLLRYHVGTIAFCSLLNGLLFPLKILANIFSFQNDQGDNCLTNCCIKCMHCLLCIFNIFLRFLSDGTYVQVAVYGTGYCTSTLNAFQVLTEGALKVAITDGMSTFFAVLGVIGISAGVSAASYFSCIYIPYYAGLLTDPIPVTVFGGIIAFFIACIFMALVDISAGSIIQCYLIDQSSSSMNEAKYCNKRIRTIIMVDPQSY